MGSQIDLSLDLSNRRSMLSRGLRESDMVEVVVVDEKDWSASF